MSRIAKAPVNLPAGVELSVDGSTVTVKGSKASLTKVFNSSVVVKNDAGVVTWSVSLVVLYDNLPTFLLHLIEELLSMTPYLS